jgi:hypothetical protein
LERVLADESNGFARELTDFAVARMEADAAAALSASSSLFRSAARQSAQSAAALRCAMRERLLADFLEPTARFHTALRRELQSSVCDPAPQLSSSSNVEPLRHESTSSAASTKGSTAVQPAVAAVAAANASTTAAAAPLPGPPASAAASSFAPSGSSGAASSNPSPFASLSGAELSAAIRSAVDAQVARVWAALELDVHYAAMGRPQNYAEKEAAVQKQLDATWDSLEL